MPSSTPVLSPDEQPIFDALVQAGVEPRLAYTAIRSIREMAAANIIARFEAKLDAQNAKLDAISSAQNSKLDAISSAQNSKLDAQNAKFDAKFDAQNSKLDAISSAQSSQLDAQDSKLRMLMWMIGAAVGVIGILIRLWG